ncbi:MAG: hypothetical protein FJ288_17255 [Planctomycetes bacterium]|nr:hypothetical protein [Planctomycetota bacterium]
MRKLLPLLVLYLAIIAAFWRWDLVDDEDRYVRYASNLVAGHYAEPGMRIWNGPGYPLVLAPFVALGAPVRFAVFLNAAFMFAAVALIRATAKPFMSERGATALAWAAGLYAPLFPETVSLLTEPLAVCLVSGFCYCIAQSVRHGGSPADGPASSHAPDRAAPRRRSLVFAVAAGACLGYLALTKVIFGYVIVAGLALAAPLAVRLRAARRAALACAVALVVCAPFLAYTQAVTGRLFYWGNSGGLSLYWMSTPYAAQYGDWTSPGDVREDPAFVRHREFFAQLEQMDYVRRDDALRRRAVANIAAHPAKALFNVAMNFSRLWFCYPNTNKLQRPHTLGYIVFNGALLAALALCAYPLWRCRRRLPPEMWLVLAFAGLSLGGSTLLSAVPRMLNPIVPVFFVIIGYTFGRLVEVKVMNLGDGVAE